MSALPERDGRPPAAPPDTLPGAPATVVVVGGGIGGLATALAVSRAGHRAVVLERAPEFAEIGAGIQIAPNGILALERLGLGDAVRAAGVHMAELRFMDGVTGEHVTSLTLTERYRRRFGNPYVVVHRAELHGLLLKTCLADARIDLRAATAVTGYRQDGRGATALLAGGGTVAGDALIGADGIHSAVRAQLVGDGEPRISGITVYRAIVPMERVPEELRLPTSVTWWAGPHCHFVHYPIAGGAFLNLAASRDNGATEAIAGVAVGEELVHAQLAGLTAPAARRLLALGEGWRSWVLVDRDPVDGWTDGRVALLGDAAHPMLHYAAQGACQALEDAVLLGELMVQTTELTDTLERFAAERHARTAAIQRAARESVRLWHPAGEDATARNKLLGGLSEDELHEHVAWMHDIRPFPSMDHHNYDGEPWA
ncbi:FAD-dependent monooxygenase [Streptomyces sp. BE20]|uniref:FAD-dependent monooxygenase n=1 Tax=Streptomyces sp. BE20 TaxID=3002525 RepID=UPI002E77AF35|nr:FAD-dependent monooxygenase [Streptomyces sp. BE20]MEE1828090.1 FAD-dependent monooxygenase [Streptomyces sp. BE20]